jgi:hypothetical protein
MSAQMMSPVAFNPAQLEDFEEVLRRAAACSPLGVSGAIFQGELPR